MGRIKSEAKAPELVQHVMRPFVDGMRDYFDVHLRIHQAHVLMLAEQGLVGDADGRLILQALRELERSGRDGLELHADTDLYMQMEAFVKDRAGGAGGMMHMGRSRNDLYACGARMLNRDKLQQMMADVLALQRVVLRRAGEHAATVMPGYTHLQHAEPITVGHFLLAFFDALTRDMTRLRAAYASTNQNALGGSALAGSSFPLDRERTGSLLGFDGLVENSYDAVAARDYLVESVAAVAILASTVTRVVDALIIWSTSEFAMIDMPDSYAYTSSIMPQKRNPGYFLESLRSKSARITGDLTAVMCTLKGTTFAQSRDTSFEITIPAFHAFAEAEGIVNVMSGVVDRLIVREQAMVENCASEFSGATELANLLVMERGLDFRSGYQIIAETVRLADERSLRPAAVTAAMIDEVAMTVVGRPMRLTQNQVHAALDPAANVQRKRTTGSPSRREVERMLASREEILQQAGRDDAARRQRQAQAMRALGEAIDARIGAGARS